MELPELSLAPTGCAVDKSAATSSSESETSSSRKRKSLSNHLFMTEQVPLIQTNVDLQLKDPLPLDWEQCLDLESGRMYYFNRKTLRKSWSCPRDQKLDLELNISALSSCSDQCNGTESLQKSKKQHSSANNMVALACLNCHLLVILSKSFPCCPNCKYVHSLPAQQIPPLKAPAGKSLDTLSLLN